MAGHRARLAYAVGLAIGEILRTSKRPTFDTFTFAENVTSKKEAECRWRRLKERLKRKYPGLRMVGVWQRQARGSWHFHALFDRFLDVVKVRAWALKCGFGAQLNCRVVGSQAGYREMWDGERVARYITRYITRDVGDGEHDDTGVRLVEYCGEARRATVDFRWVHGLAKLWRAGRQAWSEIFGVDRPGLDEFWFIVRLGWEALSNDEQQRELLLSEAVSRWWTPENYPF